jgi:acyl carrier protein
MNFDSFDCVNFIVAIEDKFNIRIDVSESMDFGTISCMAKMVDNKVQKKVKLAA